MTALPPPAEGPGSLDAAVLRIFAASGGSVGLGFLVTDRFALTCAHVVAAALGTEDDARPPVGAEVLLDLPLLGPAQVGAKARVDQWFPALSSGAGDVAVLRLDVPLAGARPVRLVEVDDVWGHPVRAYGLPDGRPGGVWHSGVLRHRQANGWVQADLVGDGYRVSPGFSGGPVWDDELAGVVGMVAVAESGEPPVSYLIPTSGLLATWPGLRELVLPPSPFRGLRPFMETDAAIFHGRRAESDEVAQIVAGTRWTTVVGPSGCGKSSLAMAGVLPRRRAAGDLPVTMRPGHHATPSHALASALLPLLEPELSETRRLTEISNLAAVLAVQGLHEIVPRVLELHGAERLLVVVDQFEELLDLLPTAVDELARVLFQEDTPAGVKVLCTLRADFLEPVLAHPRLGPVASKRVHALEPMRPDQLNKIITTPVDEIPGVRYEPGLDKRVLADAGAAPGALPLLGFTLDLLWARQDKGVLTHRAYEEIGGVAGALGGYAERAWTENVPERDRPAAERLLTQLVRAPIGVVATTRRVAPRAELGEQEWHIAQKLAATRLLVLKGGKGLESVELAHEALLTGWDRLARQVVADRSFLDWRESLRHDLDRWLSGGRINDLLPTATALAVARRWLPEHAADLSEAERDYLARGRVHRRGQTRRRRALFSGLVTIVVVALVLGSLFIYARQQSRESEAFANSRALAQASQDMAAYDATMSVMTSLAAYRTAQTQEARNQLLRQYLTYWERTRVLSGLLGDIAKFDTSQDGEVVLASTDLGRATLFVNAVTGTVRSVPVVTGHVLYPLVSRDGKRAGFVDEEGTAGWFEVHADDDRATGPVHRLPKVTGLVTDYEGPEGVAAMSADGKLIAVPASGRLTWWDLDTGTIAGSVPAPEPVDKITRLWISEDNRTLLVGTGQFSLDDDVIGLVAVDMATGVTRSVVAPRDDQALLVSGDRAVVCQAAEGSSVLRLVRISDGVEEGRPYRSQFSLCDLEAVDTTGRRVVLDGGDVVSLDDGKKIGSAPREPVGSHYVSRVISAGDKLLVASMDAAHIIYTELPESSSSLSVADLAFNADDSKVISLLTDGSLQLRPAGEGSARLLAKAPAPQPEWAPARYDLRFDRSQHLVAVRSGENVVTVRDTTTLKRTARITVPAGQPDDEFDYFFDWTGNLVTVSGTSVRQWNARTGRQLAQFDTGTEPPRKVGTYPATNQVYVITRDDPVVRVVDLHTGRTTTTMKTVPDALAIGFDHSGRYFALLRQSSILELWRRDPLQKEIGPLRSLTGRSGESVAVSFLRGEGRYLIAANNAIRIYRIGQKQPVDFYEFGQPDGSNDANSYAFMDVTKDGRTVLYGVNGSTPDLPLTLDPKAWERDLCRIIGYRDFTPDERASLPASTPAQRICPAAG